jgi:hypothetical protein
MTWTAYAQRAKVDAAGLLVRISAVLPVIHPYQRHLGTTDALFMERPSYYDLLIDLTTSTPNKASRPTFYASKPVPSQPGGSNAPSHRLSTIRFAWSDVKLVSALLFLINIH